MSPVDRLTGLNDPITHHNRIDSSRWVLDSTGQPILIPSFTEGTLGNDSRKYNFKSGTFAEYEEFKRTMKNMSKVLDWDDSQFGKEVFLSLSGKAAECINDMPTSDICNADKLFEKLDKTFLPKKYQRAVLEEFCYLKYKAGNKLNEFYEDLKTAYMKARPSAHSSIMEEDITAQLCKTIPPEVYTKCLSNFHLNGEDIAIRYDELMSRLKCDNYVKVKKEFAESAIAILKVNPKVNPCGPAPEESDL